MTTDIGLLLFGILIGICVILTIRMILAVLE